MIDEEKRIIPLDKEFAAFKEKWPNVDIYQAAAFKAGFLAGMSYPSEAVARDIWEAAEFRIQMESEEKDAPDFETFYKTLIEGK